MMGAITLLDVAADLEVRGLKAGRLGARTYPDV